MKKVCPFLSCLSRSLPTDFTWRSVPTTAEIMVRYLGPHFDRQQLQEIAKSEFSKRLKAKKWTPKP
jgi:hypothetical protein